jgi:hypothetical protein
VKKIFLLIIVFLFANPSWALVGKESHGTGGGKTADNPWFLGNDPVSYCVETEEKSLHSLPVLRELVAESLGDWKNFFRNYKMEALQFGDPSTSMRLFLDKMPRGLALNFQELKTCERVTFQEPVLRFIFSATPPATIPFPILGEFGLGAVLRDEYNHRTYRTGGVIWVDGTLKELKNIKHVLLHEMGHMFGLKHNDVWVMYDKAVEEIMSGLVGAEDQAAIGKIELPVWRYRYRTGDSFKLSHLKNFDVRKNPARELGFKSLGSTIQSVHVQIGKVLSAQPSAQDDIELQLTFEGKVPVTNSMEKITLKGKISHPGNWTPSNSSPALFTTWLTTAGLFKEPLPLRGTVTLNEERPMIFPSAGYLELGEKNFPIRFGVRYGVTLEIYFPETKVWAQAWGPPLRLPLRNAFDF